LEEEGNDAMDAQAARTPAGSNVPFRLALPVKLVILCQGMASLLLIAFAYHQHQHHVTARSRNLARCQRNLRLIYQAVEAYRRDHGGDYPLVLTQVTREHARGDEGLYPRYIRDPNVFLCPEVSDPSFPPGWVKHSYGYDLQADPGYGWFLDSRDPAVQRLGRLRDALPRQFGNELTVVWCPAHAVPDDDMPGRRLALKAGGRLVWEPGFGTAQEKLVASCRGVYGPPVR
jgi:hypothetical protein